MLEGFAAVAFAMRVSTPPVAAGWWSAAVKADHFARMLEGCQVFFLGADLAIGIGRCDGDQVL